MENSMENITKTARQAGWVDLIWILTGLYTLMYLPSQIKYSGDAAAVAHSVLSNEFLFRTGIMSGLIGAMLWVVLVLLFYQLFRSVHLGLARLMVAFVFIQIPATFMTQAFSLTSLMLMKDVIPVYFDELQQQDLAMVFLRINGYLVVSLELFWGLWLFPLGILAYRSRFLPRIIGVLLILNGVAYVILSTVTILLPEYKDLVFKLTVPAMFGELIFMFWLVTAGAKITMSRGHHM